MPVLILLTKVEVGYDVDHKTELTGVDKIKWSDSDPWVPVEIPLADYVKIWQHIKPVRIEGILVCFDVQSINAAFYQQDVQAQEGDQFAVSGTGRKNKIEYFHATGKDHEGETKDYAFQNVRIRQIEWPELAKNEAKPEPFIIHFYAEKVEEVI